MDHSLPGSSVHGISQARILEQVAISFSRRSSPPRDWAQVCFFAGRRFTAAPQDFPEDVMHHQLNRDEFEETLGDTAGQRNLAGYSPWGHKELDMT